MLSSMHPSPDTLHNPLQGAQNPVQQKSLECHWSCAEDLPLAELPTPYSHQFKGKTRDKVSDISALWGSLTLLRFVVTFMCCSAASLNWKSSTLPFTGTNLPLPPSKWTLINTNKSHFKGTSVLCKAYLSEIKLLCHLGSLENCPRPT